MDQIHVTLPDGSVKEFPKGTTPVEVAKSISPRLAEAALVAKVSATDGNGAKSKSGIFSNSVDPAEDGSLLYDLRRPLEQDVKLHILTEKDPDALYVFRHSAAHLLAAAVMELYPNVKLGIGPPVENGFFYEFLREQPFTPDDLVKIEKKMHELAAQDLPNERKLLPKPEALKLYQDSKQLFKCELIEEKADEPMVSFYTTGKFIDFCRGPHIPSTKRIQAFKLMNVAGAYWKGQEGNPQLQRIYAAAFFSQKELDDHLHRLEEAKRRDHRRLGAELDLFSIQEEAGPGLIFWHPKGGLIRTLVENWLRDELLKRGYDLVFTPHIMLFRPLEDFRPRQFLQGKHVRRGGSGKSRLPAEAHELPGPHPDLQDQAAQLPRSAGAPGGTRHRLSLRAQRRAPRLAARSRLHPGRRAHLLHSGAD